MKAADSKSRHVSVLLSEVVEAFSSFRDAALLDVTFGGGGHSRALLDRMADCRVSAFDRDGRAVARGLQWSNEYGGRLHLQQARFSQIEMLAGEVVFDGILADLGMSTDQLYEQRGFSFADEGSLDMRMDENDELTASEFVNTASERELYLALIEGGVGAHSKRLAYFIADKRPFKTSRDLAEAIRKAQLGKRGVGKSHPATVVFQAIRMKINHEREEIEAFLDAVPRLINRATGKLAVITFHSIEDALVARKLRSWESGGTYPASWRGPRNEERLGRVWPKKPVLPTSSEIAENPASRSARLRVFEFQEM
jgi:16S rRNA (cytosine1402-N4)-methyltransferase